MNVTEIKNFLKEFGISDDEIRDLFSKKRIIKKYGHYYLSPREFSENKVYDDSLIFMNLSRLVPSRFLLEWIAYRTERKVSLQGKPALQFTYGKLPQVQLKQKGNYIVTSNESIIGVLSKREKGLTNEFNIGEYLKED